jgi:hypothetical protein
MLPTTATVAAAIVTEREKEEEEEEQSYVDHCSSCDEEIVPMIVNNSGRKLKSYCDTEYIHKHSLKPWPSHNNDPHWPHGDYSSHSFI